MLRRSHALWEKEKEKRPRSRSIGPGLKDRARLWSLKMWTIWSGEGTYIWRNSHEAQSMQVPWCQVSDFGVNTHTQTDTHTHTVIHFPNFFLSLREHVHYYIDDKKIRVHWSFIPSQLPIAVIRATWGVRASLFRSWARSPSASLCLQIPGRIRFCTCV